MNGVNYVCDAIDGADPLLVDVVDLKKISNVFGLCFSHSLAGGELLASPVRSQR